MDLITRQILIEKMYEVISEEALPRPSRILIRQPTRGGHASGGKCIKMLYNNNFKITLTVSHPLYVKDENGKFCDKHDKNIKYKFMGWHDVSRERVIEIAGHEIAHLKFWKHDGEHKSYTNHLITILTNKLELWNMEG